jgi:hypothetical protein
MQWQKLLVASRQANTTGGANYQQVHLDRIQQKYTPRGGFQRKHPGEQVCSHPLGHSD